jgi:spectinomycin phosphotransferase
MLEKPDLADAKIVECLGDEFGLKITQMAFLPLGADVNTAVYRAVTRDGTPYFVKLRRGDFDEIAAVVPKVLHDQGMKQIIAPLLTRSQQLWSMLGEFNVMLYPFIEGHGGFEVNLSDQNWVEFGRALRAIHTAVLPQSILEHIRREAYSNQWREIVRGFQSQVETTTFADSVAAEFASFLKSKQAEIRHLVIRAEQLASVLQGQSLPFILCHADIHVGNLLITANDRLYVVDWDTITLAPKERDLMFVGSGLGGDGHTAEEEETLFYEGYGQTEIDPVALAYYRYERIVQDISAYCEQILLTDEGGEDRQEGLSQLQSQFLPGGVVERAHASEKHLPPELRSTTIANFSAESYCAPTPARRRRLYP